MLMKITNLFAAAVAATAGLAGCTSNTGAEVTNSAAVPVATYAAKSCISGKEIAISGNIEGNKTVRLGFLVAGKIDYIAVHEGETIGQGELLASVDPESYMIAKEMADAALDQMQDDFNRINELHERKSVSESDFVKITNGLRGAKAQQRLHAKNLADTKLISPIKGVLLKRGVEEGEIIDKGIQLFAVSDIYKVKVAASVPETELRYIKQGGKAEVYVSSLDSSFIGRIVEIGTLAEPTTRSFTVKIELNNPDLLIRPGMTAEIKMLGGKSAKPAISIPTVALLRDIDNSSYIFVADTVKNKAFKRDVALGSIIGNDIEIISGLAEGEKVVVSGMRQLSNGTSINYK